MLWSNIFQGAVLLFLTGPGIVGNTFVFVEHMYMFIMSLEKKQIDVILSHLALTNTMILFTKGIPETIAAFGLMNFLGDFGCKIVIYLWRVSRGLSICTTSLLSVVQATTFRARDASWMKLIPRTPWHDLHWFLCFWIFNSLMKTNLLYSVKTISNITTSTFRHYANYCSIPPSREIMTWIFLVLMILQDVFFMGFMTWASSHMALLLHEHHKHVLYLKNSRCSHKTTPEIKAIQSILLLMFCFLSFYWTDCILSFYVASLSGRHSIAINIEILLTLGYAIVSPFILIIRNSCLTKCWQYV